MVIEDVEDAARLPLRVPKTDVPNCNIIGRFLERDPVIARKQQLRVPDLRLHSSVTTRPLPFTSAKTKTNAQTRKGAGLVSGALVCVATKCSQGPSLYPHPSAADESEEEIAMVGEGGGGGWWMRRRREGRVGGGRRVRA
jgi:hypothetical protein